MSLHEYVFSGGGSLKVICNLFNPEEERIADKGDRGTYSGINHAVVLAYCDNLNESHENLRALVDLLSLHECKYSLAADMKLINILLGISVSGISHTLRIFVCHDAQKVVVRPHVRDSAVHRADF